MTLQDIEPDTTRPLSDLDEAAFAAGLAELMPFVRLFARSLTGKVDLAEDLAQEALAKAWQARRSFTPGTNLRAWLCTILRHEHFSYRRRAWRQIPWDSELFETVAAPAAEQQWAAELSDMAQAMHGLPETHRKALILVAVGGLSYKDAAVFSKSAEGTMKSRVARARRILRKVLDGDSSRPIKSRPANGNAMNDILAQLSHLIGADAPRSVAATAMHGI